MRSFLKIGLNWILSLVVDINTWREEKAVWGMVQLYEAFSVCWPSGWHWFEKNLLQPRLLNFPNLLSVSRILLTWPLLKCVHTQNFLLAGFYFLLIILTDFFDGPAAMAGNCKTTWGKFIDPLADKILVISVMIVQHNYHPILLWELILAIAFGEGLYTIMRIVKILKSIEIASNYWGKTKYFIQFGIVLLIFCKINVNLLSQFGLNTLLIISGMFLYYNIGTGLQSLWYYRKLLTS